MSVSRGTVAAVLLAAGTSSRYRAADPTVASKLLVPLDGLPLVRHAALAALASRARPVVVVTGHAAAEVRRSLAGLDLAFVHNSRFADGLSTSVSAGLAALPATVEGALMLLGDMPAVSGALLDRLIEAFGATDADAVVPVHDARRGNPALLGEPCSQPPIRCTATRAPGDCSPRPAFSRSTSTTMRPDWTSTIPRPSPGRGRGVSPLRLRALPWPRRTAPADRQGPAAV